MKKKIIGIFVCVLLIATAIPAVGEMNNDFNEIINLKSSKTNTNIAWTEDFDSYEAGSLLHGQGGWEAWDLNTVLSPFISNSQCYSSPNSIKLEWVDGLYWSDVIHMFYGVNSGQWTLTTSWFLPDSFYGVSNFVLHNTYEHGVHVFPRDI